MNEIFLPPENAFFEHRRALLFLKRTYEGKDRGQSSMPQQEIKQISAEFGLRIGEAAALAFLAKNRIEGFEEELEMGVVALNTGETE